jgi:colanic acid biosynthesis glycosyl transferase WcaI
MTISHLVRGTSARTRVGFISQWYAPEPSTVPVWIAETLVRSGFEVQVLTGQPNLPTGNVYAGYSASRFVSETINDIAVQR